MNNYIFFAIAIIVGISVGFIIFTENENTQSDAKNVTLLTAKKLTSGGSPILGNPNAEITILEWGDYQCTFCFKFHDTSLKSIQEKYIDSGKVKLVFKDFPLNGPDSILGAEATYCAGDQGKYWQYHDELYSNWAGERTGWINRDSLNEFAKIVGLNLDSFNSCLDDNKYRQKVLELEQFGKEIGIDATPSFLIFNDEKIIKIRGNQPLDVFFRTIDGL